MFIRKFRIVILTMTFVIVGMITTVAGQCVEAPSDLKHWWTADGNTFDIIGGEHGLLVGGAAYGAGEVGQAFDLDGDNDQVVVPNNTTAPYNFTGAFTIDAWIFLDAAPTQFAPIVSKWNDIGTDNRGYFLAVEFFQGQPRLRFDVSRNGLFGGTNSAIRYASSLVPTGQWLHVAGVFDPSETVTNRLRVYTSGTDASGAFFIPNEVTSVFVNDEPLRIGAGDLGSDTRDFFNGRIDEVELFDRALTAAEIMEIFAAGSNGKTVPITIDVKPGSHINPINLGSRGTTPVALLGTEVFDVTTVDVTTVRFAGAPIRTKPNGTLHYSYEDVNGDGILDLMMHFSTQALMLDSDSTEATLTGTGGQDRCISGTDTIVIVPHRGGLPVLGTRTR